MCCANPNATGDACLAFLLPARVNAQPASDSLPQFQTEGTQRAVISSRAMKWNLLLALGASLLAGASSQSIAGNDDAFLRARQAYYAQDTKGFERQAARVDKNYALYPYLEYWRISWDISSAGDAAVADFLSSQPGTWLAERLRADWLKDLGRRELWPAYLPEYVRLANPDLTHQCFARRAEFAAGDMTHLREAVSLWFSGSDLPSACTPLFSRLISLGYLGQEDIWRRLRLSLQAGNPGVAKAVVTALPPELRPDPAVIDKAGRDPENLLKSGALDLARRFQASSPDRGQPCR